MSLVQPFSPSFGTLQSQPLSATTASSSIALDANAMQIRVVNAGAATVFFRYGIGAQTALTTDCPILPNTVEVFSKGSATFFAGITSSGTATLYVTNGNGL